MAIQVLGIEKRTDYAGYSVRAEFKSILDVLAQKSGASGPYILYGEDIHEEMSAVSAANTFEPGFVGERRGIIASFKQRYRGRLDAYYRPTYFLHRQNTIALSNRQEYLDEEVLERIYRLSRHDLFGTIINEYVGSRRKKAGADEQIIEIMDLLTSQPINKPLVMYARQMSEMTFIDVVALWMWVHGGRAVPLILCAESYSKPAISFETFSREYISLQSFLPIAASYLEMDEAQLRNATALWKAYLHAGGRQAVADGNLSAHLAVRLVATAASLEPLDDIAAITQLIPHQRPAPLTFQLKGDEIAAAPELVANIAAAHVVGPARALKNQVGDILALGGLENAIPRYQAKLQRIASILDRIASSSTPAEDDIIEYGVEMMSLEARVYEGKSRIGELTIGELLSFIISSKSFLGRFATWNEYRTASAGRDHEVTVDQAQTALHLLRAFLDAPAGLSEDARHRISSFTSEEGRDEDDPVINEGYAISAENLAAEASRGLLQGISREAKSVGGEFKKEVTGAVAKTTADVFLKNAPKFLEFAASRGGQWFEVLLEHLDDLLH